MLSSSHISSRKVYSLLDGFLSDDKDLAEECQVKLLWLVERKAQGYEGNPLYNGLYADLGPELLRQTLSEDDYNVILQKLTDIGTTETQNDWRRSYAIYILSKAADSAVLSSFKKQIHNPQGNTDSVNRNLVMLVASCNAQEHKEFIRQIAENTDFPHANMLAKGILQNIDS